MEVFVRSRAHVKTGGVMLSVVANARARPMTCESARNVACAHLLRVICAVPIFAFSDCSHWTRVLRGSTATKVLVPGGECCGECVDRRR